ncbi:lamin tail domain-containing protein [Pontibacter liquoris]|uniref:lamin tail domain-containing protein n=1 Tax=Pontibacter liquoris TaxID=2905677 RepID=UPI001FA7F055|nr:lamin tail domain-containing protein [Pontibacter liquoris]
MKQGLLLLLLFLPLLTQAQWQETFSDGNFTQAPKWAGDSSSFSVNALGQLQSKGPAVTGTTLQLATPVQTAAGTTWEFWAHLQLATSSGNYADVFLAANAADLKSTATSGYFVRLGGTSDEVSLFRKDAGKRAVMLIDGQDGTMAGQPVRVRVTRSITNAWELELDSTGTGQQYISQGTATDATYPGGGYFGVLLTYSAANSHNFYFDDFRITDTQPPVLQELLTTGPQELTLRFNEPLQPEQAQQVTSYTLNGSIKPVLAELLAPELIRLVFAQSFPAGDNLLRIADLADLHGNSLAAPLDVHFTSIAAAVLPGYNELLITEIMADETPAVGLLAQEYIELYNPTAKELSMKGVRFSDATSTATLPDVQLLPGEYAVVVPNTQVQHFTRYGKVIGISNFPGLNNSGELLQLRRPGGQLIYAVKYDPSWYKDPDKAEGGWSLEMIDVTNPCAGTVNWAASTAAAGGTPAQANAVAASNPDHMPPALIAATATAADQLLLTFNEKLDSLQAARLSNYRISPGISITGVQVTGPLFEQVILALATPLQENQLYTITAAGIADCAGNLAGQPLQLTFALPAAPEPGDVVINEVLFNPRPGGVDFVELVNRSSKHLDLRSWQLANTAGDSVASARTITTQGFILAPGQYVVLTSDPANIKSNYPAAKAEAFLKMTTLPALPDEEGTVVLLQPDGGTADRFSYTEKMHFALIHDVNGVSLERVRLDGPSISSNFHSAATTVLATPGYRNSQTQGQVQAKQVFAIAPDVFSPDEDGFEDFTTINYRTGQPGLLVNITVFDAQGREIRKLVRNELLAAEGFFQWDGLRQDGTKASIGAYLFYIELSGLNGEKQVYKEKVVVGGLL